MLEMVYHWCDLLWIPVIFFLVHKQHRWWAGAFALSCVTLMHMQVELMQSLGFTNGFIGFTGFSAYDRALIVYSIFYILFLIMAHFSPRTIGVVFMAACISIMFMAFFTSTFIMIL